MKAIINLLFNSKILNLNTYLYLNVNNNLNFNLLKENNSNIFYIVFINIKNNYNLLLISSEHDFINEDKQFLFDSKIEKYNEIYNYFDKNIYKLENIEKNNIKVYWKNQFIISELIDFFTEGWIENLPLNWESFNKSMLYENKINTLISKKINKWLKDLNIDCYEEIEKYQIKEILK